MLEIERLRTHFFTSKGVAPAVDDVTMTIPPKSVVGVVGESGCGKSVTALSVLRLVSSPGRIVSGSIRLDGEELLTKSGPAMRAIRGDRISMIFQEPMTSLNPVYTVGRQVSEAITLHMNAARAEARDRTVELFKAVGIPEPEKRFKSYPHQLSGGLRQRVMIAMAMACRPEVLIADEPTTALDVTTEAQILHLMKELETAFGASIMLITHNLGVVAEMCDYVYVMYAGRIMEQADVFELFDNALHPYTTGLLGAIPRPGAGEKERRRLFNIEGMVPNLLALPKGCRFSPRCGQALARCREEEPELYAVGRGHSVRCFLRESETGAAP
ncbi:MAG: ABC transporter ATP-binding protein [Synergistaceae bacterium]|jgi:peptide/nickel transport system ATP-binding protein/oligopeptide transport system ATP-binding protein|nr:ABC transporter ATP-binding protein [Synergistaceae bacterium]